MGFARAGGLLCLALLAGCAATSAAATDRDGDSARVSAAFDDAGPPQQPRVAAGEHLGISLFAVPRCGAAELGRSPVLTVTLADDVGRRTTRRVPVDDAKHRITAIATSWCHHGVSAVLQSATGTDKFCFDDAEFLVQNPTLQRATLRLEGTSYSAAAVTLPASGSVTWKLTRTPTCASSSSKAIATALFADGTTGRVDLPFP